MTPIRLIPLLALLLFGLWAGVNEWPGNITAVDVNQHRLNTPLPALTPDKQVSQTFTPTRPGLSEIELLAVRWEGQPEEIGAQLILQLWRGERLVAEERYASRLIQHNQPLIFRFAPEWDSAGQRYELRLTAANVAPISVWGYSLDNYPGGELTTAPESTNAQTLRFAARYQLNWRTAVAILAEMVRADGWLTLLAIAFMVMPGALFLLILGQRGPIQPDTAAWWGMALALGLAIWPLLWLWFSLLGGRWTGWLLWLIFAGGWAAILYFSRGFLAAKTAQINISGYIKQDRLAQAALLLLLLVSVGVRLLAVRDLAYPPWVDSGRHGLITAVMADTGRMLHDYEPYLPVYRSPYHFGFHTLSASLTLMSGADMPRLLLLMGQLLNGLLPLMMSTAVYYLTRRPWAGLLAAFLVGLPFFFPAYYATWGRMTQLTGMMVMPLLLAMSWLLSQHGRWRPLWPIVALLLAGLFLIHFRVFLIYLPYLALILLLSGHSAVDTVIHRVKMGVSWRQAVWQTPVAALLASGAAAGLLIFPRLIELIATTNPVQRGLGQSPAGYNDFPTGYLTAGWETYFAWAGGAAALLVVIAGLRGRRWATFPLVLLVWVGLLFLSLAGGRIGLPEFWLINLNSMYITLFVPLALLLSLTAWQIQRWGRRRHLIIQTVGATAVTLFLAAAALFGVRQQIAILNPSTIFAFAGDQAGIAWLDENLPDDALIAVNSWLWLGNTWSASDGGIWITPLTGRQTMTPPADYIYEREFALQIRAFNEAAWAVENWERVEAAVWLREQGVTHIYVGAKGGYFDPAALSRNPGLALLYQHDGVFIFAVE